MSATSQFSLPRAYLIGQPAVCSGVVLSVCRVVLQSPRSRHARLATDKSLASSSDTPDLLVTCQRHPREDAARKLLPWNSSFTRLARRCFRFRSNRHDSRGRSPDVVGRFLATHNSGDRCILTCIYDMNHTIRYPRTALKSKRQKVGLSN